MQVSDAVGSSTSSGTSTATATAAHNVSPRAVWTSRSRSRDRRRVCCTHHTPFTTHRRPIDTLLTIWRATSDERRCCTRLA